MEIRSTTFDDRSPRRSPRSVVAILILDMQVSSTLVTFAESLQERRRLGAICSLKSRSATSQLCC